LVAWLVFFSGASLNAQDLSARLQPLIAAHKGQAAVAVKHLKMGASFTHRADEPMPTASLIKFPVMIEAYRQADAGKIELAKAITLHETEKAPGSGILTSHFSAGMQLSVRDAVRLMIAFSDNTATNLVLDQIGLRATAETMEKLGCPHTKIHAKVFRRETSVFPERSERFGLGSTTAAEMVRLLEMLHRGELVSREASQTMLAHLHACEDRSKLSRFLPQGTRIAHKTGSVADVRTDAGIIETPGGPVAVCVLTSRNEDRRFVDDNAGNRLCADIGKAVYDHFAVRPPLAAPTPFADGRLTLGAQGELVADLQRTLNARLKSSLKLDADGEFGPGTQAAVRAFQKSHNLAETGAVGPETWKALGPLVTSDPPVPEPAAINQKTLAKKPADADTGPPFVTCKAWAIGDGRSDSLLWGSNETRPLDFASTTKIMTAYVVLELARTQPKILDEQMIFSRRADETPGSTAGIRAGERLSVREALYGLMLPSGNDAATALAEHFGGRFSAPDEKGASTDEPLRRFVAEMNRTAKRIGMTDSRYANPHGLTAKEHRATARELMHLAWTAMQNPLFREYVQTRQRGCTVTGPGGYRRHVLWKNTNELLEMEGYEGVKTGTTTAAGACLVSCATRGKEQLIVVVLGSTSGDARYVDTRNLFRWAWEQRKRSQ
jgi:D-alanyl-D-alanine carboxypeptidase (penicillin-binding protein 5/6)